MKFYMECEKPSDYKCNVIDKLVQHRKYCLNCPYFICKSEPKPNLYELIDKVIKEDLNKK